MGRLRTLIVPLHAEMDKETLRGLLVQGCRFVPAEELWAKAGTGYITSKLRLGHPESIRGASFGIS